MDNATRNSSAPGSFSQGPTSGNGQSPLDFLRQLHPNGSVALTSILDGNVETCNDWDKAEAFIARANGHRNLYYNPNEVVQGLIGRASKEHIVSARCAHVDIDPKKGLQG